MKKILFLLTALLLISCNRDINSDADLFVSSTKMKLELDNKLKKIWASGNEFSLENLEKKKSIFEEELKLNETVEEIIKFYVFDAGSEEFNEFFQNVNQLQPNFNTTRAELEKLLLPMQNQSDFILNEIKKLEKRISTNDFYSSQLIYNSDFLRMLENDEIKNLTIINKKIAAITITREAFNSNSHNSINEEFSGNYISNHTHYRWDYGYNFSESAANTFFDFILAKQNEKNLQLLLDFKTIE
jgi:hypothetical protein